MRLDCRAWFQAAGGGNLRRVGRGGGKGNKEKSDYAIQTVTNALRVLDTLGAEGEIGVADLSRELSLHKNNIFRLLATLEEQGYVEQNLLTERYRLGLRSLDLGQAFARENSLALRGRASLEALVVETGESAHLAVSDTLEVVAIEGIASERALVAARRVGVRHPLHCTALGKVLLANSTEATRRDHHDAVLAQRGLPQRTAHTISLVDKFLEELRGVASLGYAFDREEFEIGLCCVAAPVQDASGAVVAALSVSVPRARYTEDGLQDRILPAVANAAGRLSRELGAPA